MQTAILLGSFLLDLDFLEMNMSSWTLANVVSIYLPDPTFGQHFVTWQAFDFFFLM